MIIFSKINIADVFRRFPVSILIMGVFSLLLMGEYYENQTSYRLLIGLIIAAYMGVMVRIHFEVRGKVENIIPLIPIQAAIAIAVPLGFYLMKAHIFTVGFSLIATLSVLGNFITPWGERQDVKVWDFTHKLWIGAGFAILGSVIFAVGMMIITAALNILLGINIETLVQHIFLPVGLGLFAPIYWLSTLPHVDDDHSCLIDNPNFVSRAVAFLALWLLAPLCLIYALILSIYGLSIIISWELPKGEIGLLVPWFLIVGSLTWILLDPPFISKARIARYFRRFWFWLSVPAGLLLLMAISVRVAAYGLTAERIILIVIVVWMLGLAFVYTVGPKSWRDIRVIPGLAAVLIVLMAFMARPLSHWQQTQRLETHLIEAGILQAGQLVPSGDIPTKDARAASQAKSILQYLVRDDWSAKLLIEWGAEPCENPPRQCFSHYETALGLSDIIINRRGRGLIGTDENVQDETKFYKIRTYSYENENVKASIEGYKTFWGKVNMFASLQGVGVSETQFDGLEVISRIDKTIFIFDGFDPIEFDFRAWCLELNLNEDKKQINLNNPYIVLNEGGDKTLFLIVHSLIVNKRQNDLAERCAGNFWVLSK